jgi:hypothetical protein
LGTAKGKQTKTIPLFRNGRRVAELFILIRLVADLADGGP